MIYAGIDEAGYGPLLGPLCVGASAFRVSFPPQALLDTAPPDLWKLLESALCRKPRDPKRRIAIADSKKLKSAGKQPLAHLERGVLAFAACEPPENDRALLNALGVHPRATSATPWHETPQSMPVSHSAAEIAIARNLLANTLAKTGVVLEHFGVAALDAPGFNALYETLRNKARVNMSLVFDAARNIDLLRGDEPTFLAIDRQGGRSDYTAELEAHVARGARVRTIVEDGERSTYEIGEGLVLSFEVGAEERHLPVALASMGAKFVRELSMRRLNAFFTARMPSLAPTAGYVEDGRRYLAEVKPILAAEAIREQDFVRVV